MNWYVVVYQKPTMQKGAYDTTWFADKDAAKKAAREWADTHPGSACYVVMVETAVFGAYATETR